MERRLDIMVQVALYLKNRTDLHNIASAWDPSDPEAVALEVRPWKLERQWSMSN